MPRLLNATEYKLIKTFLYLLQPSHYPLHDDRSFWRYHRLGVEIMGVRRTKSGLDLKHILRNLGGRSMTNIMVEGGGKTLGAFFDAGLADEAIVFVAPCLIGGRQACSPLAGMGLDKISEAAEAFETKVSRSGDDTVYSMYLRDPVEYLR